MAPILQTIMKQTRSRPIGFAPEVILSAHSWISERKEPKINHICFKDYIEELQNYI